MGIAPCRRSKPKATIVPYLSTAEWDELLADALDGRGLGVAFQPIVDLRAGKIVGYEALARFAGPAGLRPDHWFRAARARGVVARLDAAALEAALAHQSVLPPGCFLSINVEPDSIGHPAVDAALRAASSQGLVVELTEHVPVEADGYLERRLAEYRARGVQVAVDDAGSGYAGLQHILRLRPSLLKLDRAIVECLERDDAKVALIQMLAVFAERIGASLLAEGVEQASEAAALGRLGVPLAQGFFFAEPGPPWPQLRAGAARFFADPDSQPGPSAIESAAAPPTLASLVDPATAVTSGEAAAVARRLAAADSSDHAVVLDAEGHAVGLVDRSGVREGLVVAVRLSSSLAEVARSMLSRPAGERFSPVVCDDERGRFVGLLYPERLLEALATLAGGHPAGTAGRIHERAAG